MAYTRVQRNVLVQCTANSFGASIHNVVVMQHCQCVMRIRNKLLNCCTKTSNKAPTALFHCFTLNNHNHTLCNMHFLDRRVCMILIVDKFDTDAIHLLYTSFRKRRNIEHQIKLVYMYVHVGVKGKRAVSRRVDMGVEATEEEGIQKKELLLLKQERMHYSCKFTHTHTHTMISTCTIKVHLPKIKMYNFFLKVEPISIRTPLHCYLFYRLNTARVVVVDW